MQISENARKVAESKKPDRKSADGLRATGGLVNSWSITSQLIAFHPLLMTKHSSISKHMYIANIHDIS